jgi:predicted glycosyltransferase
MRDILTSQGHNAHDDQYRRHVLDTLRTYFDRILVHADPRLISVEDSIPWAAEISVPIDYTGYVAQPLARNGSARRRHSVVVSVGGAGQSLLVARAREAWAQLRGQAEVNGRSLIVFLPLYGYESAKNAERLSAGPAGDSVRIMSFTPSFLDWLHRADLSVSHAGYNTCTELLLTRTPAILVPDPRMSDQCPRARILASRGLAQTLDLRDLTSQRLADAIVAGLSRRMDAGSSPHGDVNLDGAQTTRRIIERL